MENTTKIGLILCLALALTGAIGMAEDTQHTLTAIDYGVITSFDQYVSHSFPEQELYQSYRIKQINFTADFNETPTITCNCYQDDKLFHYYTGQLECEVYNKTTEGFKGQCNALIDMRFRDEHGYIYSPHDIRLEYHAIGKAQL